MSVRRAARRVNVYLEGILDCRTDGMVIAFEIASQRSRWYDTKPTRQGNGETHMVIGGGLLTLILIIVLLLILF